MTLELVIWDVQHGNATYVKTPNGRHIVQDLGTGSYKGENSSFSPLTHLKNQYNVERIDALIVSHPHKDHISDILNIDELNPKRFTRPSGLTKDDVMNDIRDEDKPYYEKYIQLTEEYTHTVVEENKYEIPNNWGEMKIELFRPSIDETNINNCSLVTVFSYATSKIILPGDNEASSWEELLQSEKFISAIKDADILLASHHGRESGWCDDLFDHFKPKLTIISDGRFGDTSATDRYSEISTGWKVYKRSGGDEDRFCITTRNDGVIVVKFGLGNNSKPYINVRID